MMTLRLHNPLRRLAETAPILALAIMLLLPMVLRQEKDSAELVLARNLQVKEAVLATPYRLGDWVGEDVEVPASAVELLHPNAILSRRFRKLGSPLSAHLLIVHCSDARDMQGHYPPVCYPASGWVRTEEDGGQERADVLVGGETINLRVYNFRRLNNWGGESRVRVFNYFILPTGETTIDLVLVNRLVERSAFSVQGVAQVQLVLSGELDFEVDRAGVEDLLNAARPLLERLGQSEREQG